MREEGRYTEIAIRVDKHQLKLSRKETQKKRSKAYIFILIEGKEKYTLILIEGGRIIYIYLHYRVPL